MPRKKTPCVYVITNLVNGKKYVGKTNFPTKRWSDHRTSARTAKPRSAVAQSMRKHGLDYFRFDVIEWHPTEEDALVREQFWIEELRTNVYGVGYNLDGGGHGGKTLTAETRKKNWRRPARKAEKRRGGGEHENG